VTTDDDAAAAAAAAADGAGAAAVGARPFNNIIILYYYVGVGSLGSARPRHLDRPDRTEISDLPIAERGATRYNLLL